jgi:hypothetical protein
MFTYLTIAVLALVATFAVLCRYAPRGEEHPDGFHPLKDVPVRSLHEESKLMHLVFRVVSFFR